MQYIQYKSYSHELVPSSKLSTAQPQTNKLHTTANCNHTRLGLFFPLFSYKDSDGGLIVWLLFCFRRCTLFRWLRPCLCCSHSCAPRSTRLSQACKTQHSHTHASSLKLQQDISLCIQLNSYHQSPRTHIESTALFLQYDLKHLCLANKLYHQTKSFSQHPHKVQQPPCSMSCLWHLATYAQGIIILQKEYAFHDMHQLSRNGLTAECFGCVNTMQVPPKVFTHPMQSPSLKGEKILKVRKACQSLLNLLSKGNKGCKCLLDVEQVCVCLS